MRKKQNYILKGIFNNMKKSIVIILAIYFVCLMGCSSGVETVTIKTSMGDMVVELYNSTPEHKENFLKLVEENFYDSLLFHRVMQGFMIQGGDPNSKNAPPNVRLGAGGPGYTIPAEIGAPHFKGTLAAARTPDVSNPERRSSGSQFYIVQGINVTDQVLSSAETQFGIKYNESQKKKYKEIGGYPMLDGQYTVFGEVIKGMDVIDKIAAVKTVPGDRPVEDVWMIIEK
jgi:peptidyl-prolyl cis-trans isomerase B (cyclophilin B)